MSVRSLLRLFTLALTVTVLWPAATAHADAARPGNPVSVVDSMSPPAPAVTADIVGGDAFLRLRVTPGVEVRVPGYGGEPYLWIRPDGTVWRNAESPATVLNEDRYITGDTPEVPTGPAPSLAEPRWESYGHAGTVLWHDHRVHWMGSGDPPTIDPNGLVQRWEVPITVDGVEVLISGRLLRREAASPAWWGVALVSLALALWLRRRWIAALPVASMVTGAGTAVVAWWSWADLPSPARSAPALAVLASLSVGCAGLALWRHRTMLAGPLLAGAGMGLVMVAWLGRGGVTAAVIPGWELPWLWRVLVAASVGVGVLALWLGAQTASRSRAPVSLEG